jgi:acetyl esterase/lipase
MTIFDKKERIIDVADPKWAHPEATFTWMPAFDKDPYSYYDDESLSYEQKLEAEKTLAVMFVQNEEYKGDCSVEEYEVPGCVEEPDTKAKAIAITPKNLTTSRSRALFKIEGGGMYQCIPNITEAAEYAERLNCVVVMPVYRTALQGQYPASVNDCHAAYQWMVDNAETLHIDIDNVVITGLSTGAHLSCSLPFRIMKYGLNPRGIVASMPASDDRGYTTSARLFPGLSNCIEAQKATRRWLGDKLASSVLGPEAYANRATVEECIGYPPLFLHTAEFDLERDNNLSFASKVLEAQSFVELHEWGGLSHVIVNFSGSPCPALDRIDAMVKTNIEDCFKYDLRRPWVYEKTDCREATL